MLRAERKCAWRVFLLFSQRHGVHNAVGIVDACLRRGHDAGERIFYSELFVFVDAERVVGQDFDALDVVDGFQKG